MKPQHDICLNGQGIFALIGNKVLPKASVFCFFPGGGVVNLQAHPPFKPNPKPKFLSALK
jgi:hypothetical protein